MRTSMLSIGEFIHCKYYEYDEKKQEVSKVGVKFHAKQTSVADIVAFQTRKGFTEEISNPIPGLESSSRSIEIYTTDTLPFKKFDKVEVRVGAKYYMFTVDSASRLMDSAYAIKNMRTGGVEFPKVLRLR